MQEEYRVINDYPNYSVSNWGRVRNDKTGKILDFKNRGFGYVDVILYKNKSKTIRSVHKLVATAFIPNDEKYRHVIHLNGQLFSNFAYNLKWCSVDEKYKKISLRKNNTSGSPGVSFCKKTQKWKSYLRFNNKTIHLGYFDSICLAANARFEKKLEIYGGFANYENHQLFI